MHSQPCVVNPLTVAYNKSGKPRLVLDCRHINVCLFKFRYRYEDDQVARDLFDTGDFLFTFDLRSAYHHISIFAEHRQYLGFSSTINGKQRFYTFNVLPFGLSTAGFIFSKVTRHFVKFMRSKNVKIVMYLDDGLSGGPSYSEACRVSRFVREQLEKFGFLLAHDKCSWNPSQNIVWLGLQWDFQNGLVRVSEKRINRVKSLADDILKKISYFRHFQC